MDFTKFVSLLEKQALFFVRSTKLSDPFEGSYTKANVEQRSIQLQLAPGAQQIISGSFRDLKKFMMLNCWNLNQHESAALWKLYISGSEGVAVRSTFKRLTDSFKGVAEDIYVGRVVYIDYETEWVPDGNIFYPYLHKRKSFEYEQELRALIYRAPLKITVGEQQKLDLSQEPIDSGSYIEVNIDILIDEIRVSPTAEEWFLTLVRSVLQQFGVSKMANKSSLLADPVF